MEEPGIQSFSTCTFYYRNIAEGLNKAKEALWRKPLQMLTQLLSVLLLRDLLAMPLGRQVLSLKGRLITLQIGSLGTRRFPQRPD